MDFKELFLTADGRISRQPWWIGVILLAVVNIGQSAILGDSIGLIVSLILVVPSVMVSIKRCHDRGKTGWWCLLFIIPLVGAIWAIVDLGILKGEEGPNQYGADPLL